MTTSFRNMAITLMTLAHTGKKQGDDAGYRKIGFIPEDETNPDPLVDLAAEGFKTLPVYAPGHNDHRVTGGRYEGGIGGTPHIFVRRPVVNALWKFRALMMQNGLDALFLDGYRPDEVQRRGFAYLVGEIMADRHPGKAFADLSIVDQFMAGLAADDVFAYVNAKGGEKFDRAVAELIEKEQKAFEFASAFLNKKVSEIAEEVVTYRANLGLVDIELDANAPMAHRGGGATDLFPLDLKSGNPALLGVPFDYPCPAGVALTPSAMHFFEDEGNWAEYKRLAQSDLLLRKYLLFNGVSEVTDAVCEEIRDIRRVIFHAAYAAGGTHFFLEPFHLQWPNIGGNQEAILPGGGNTCQSLLRNVRDVRTGQIMGNWSGCVADLLAAELFDKK